MLSKAGGKLFLLSDQNLDVKPYHTLDENTNIEGITITWKDCTLRTWLNETFLNSAFPGDEKGAILQTTLQNADNPSGASGGGSTTDSVFLLSIEEAKTTDYFPNNNNSSRIGTNTAFVAAKRELSNVMSHPGEADRWWLRSPNFNNIGVAIVNGKKANPTDTEPGSISDSGIDVSATDCTVRPAFNLNLQSVLFTSAAERGKADSAVDGTLTVVDAAPNTNEWKLTLLDSTHNNFQASTTSLTTNSEGYSNWTVDVTYSNAKLGGNEYVSALLCDAADNALYYGRIAQGNESGTKTVTIPSGLSAGTYKLNIFSEQCNGDKKTDYARGFKDITLTVTNPALNVTAPAFASVQAGYSQPEAGAITIQNTSNTAVTISNVTVSNPTAFTIVSSNNKSVAANGSNTDWKIQPKAGLSAGTHTGTITVACDNNKTATASVTFTVTQGAAPAPPAPPQLSGPGSAAKRYSDPAGHPNGADSADRASPAGNSHPADRAHRAGQARRTGPAGCQTGPDSDGQKNRRLL